MGVAVSIIVFLVGTPFYRNKLPTMSLFIRMDQVIVASVRKWKVPVPGDPKQLHELSLEEYIGSGKFRIAYTSSLGFLDKAAVESGSRSPWMLCPVAQVEETKQMIKMLPVWAATFIPSAILAQVHTLFIKQGTVLDSSMGPHFKIPPACLTAFVTISMFISLAIYDRYFVLMALRSTKRPRGITLLQRMEIGFTLHVIVMITAYLAERKRLSVAREHNIIGKNEAVPLSIFILLPQFVLMGIADNFVEVAKIEFFYDQEREGMKSLGTSYIATFLGIGNFISGFLLSTVSKITKKHGHKGWILDNLNLSHLDYYLSFLAISSSLNFLLCLVAASFFVYNVNADTKRDMQEQKENSPVKAHQDNENLKVG